MNTINSIIARFREEGKHVLANAIDRSKSMTIAEYSQLIFQYRPVTETIEEELAEAFLYEFQRQGLGEQEAGDCLRQLIQQRSLQCAHHVGLVHSPRMLCIDWLTSQGLKDNEWYMVGAFSGVPFSNSSRPGRMTFGNAEINFVPKTYQDALVFSAMIPEKTLKLWDTLPIELRDTLPHPSIGASFSHWALSIMTEISKKILEREKIIYFDINHVVTRYLIHILKKNNAEHPLVRMLLDTHIQKTIIDSLGEELHFFYSPYDKGKYQKQESLYVDGMGFQGEYNYYACNREQLIQALESNQLCPATFLTFTVLACLNQFQCFGSFSQVEYLTRFRLTWEQLGFLQPYRPEKTPTDTLTTAMFPTDRDILPLDIFLSDKQIPGDKNDILGKYYATIWQ
ncbi:hypothetical protein H6776_02445 [Candidatus Nomurabacteria bacterium]|nr:hypothetical protein [Candidatus Nomurabacteria bacterium]